VLNAKTSFNKRVITDLQNTADGLQEIWTDQRVVSVADLLQDRLENITYKPGHGSGTITSDGGTSGVQHCVCFDYSSYVDVGGM
jgi:hypothetical protein